MLDSTREMCASIGAHICSSRKELGWSQEVLAQKAGVSRRSITRIERGDYNATIKVLVAIHNALGQKLIIAQQKKTSQK